jgi:D-3-phosphoglycerate dehydrogenase
MFRVLYNCNLQPQHIELMCELGCTVHKASKDRMLTADELAREIPGHEALIIGLDPVTRAVLEAGSELKVVSRFGTGLDSVDVEAATELGIIVTNAPGANAIAVAELAIGLVFCLLRHIPLHDARAKAGDWSRTRGDETVGRTLGVVGLGRVGKGVASRAVALGMRVLGCDTSWDARFAGELGVERVSLSELLQRSDIVSLHIPSTPETRGLVGARELQMMKPGARLINTARGDLIDQGALYEALISGHLAGAAIDVWPVEPPEHNPLVGLENVIATVHLGGESVEAQVRMSQMAMEGVLSVVQGERPQHLVNPEVYERSWRAQGQGTS